jgi:pSer/pThr/pTyr-binding forkhead associated (FHA) protein
MLSCPRCGGINSETGTFCQFCGAGLGATGDSTQVSTTGASGAMVACPACSTPNPVGTNFCHNCGARLDVPPEHAPVIPIARAAHGGDGGHGRARLVGVRRDGSDGNSYDITSDQFDIGRSEGDLLFDDPHMAPRHARIAHRDGQRLMAPLETRNGVYVRIRQPTELHDGDCFLIGKQVLRFEVPFEVEKTLRPAVEHGVVFFGTPVKPPWGRLRQLTAAGTSRDIYHLTRAEVTMGREQGDIVFGDDEFLSRRHAQLGYRGNRVSLLDLSSSNGTFVRLRGQHLLTSGDLIRMGDELLRFEIG